MLVLINVGIMALGVGLLSGAGHYWDRDRPVAISCIVTEVLFIAAMLLLAPGSDGT